MDWLRKVPIGQFVDGRSSWLRRIDPRLKLAWVLMFLLTPLLAGVHWRLFLVLALCLITVFSSLPLRILWRPCVFLLMLAVVVGLFAMTLPTGDPPALFFLRFPQELPGAETFGKNWELFKIGPLSLGPLNFGSLVIDRRSAELGLNTSTLIFTLVHSVNLMLITTPPEDLVWTISWFIAPLATFGVPVERVSFQLLLALRFLPLVQEELQNLFRALSSRALSMRRLGFKASFGLLLSVGERLLANILLRSEQGADALLARGGVLISPNQIRPISLFSRKSIFLNLGSTILLMLILSLRAKYGTF